MKLTFDYTIPYQDVDMDRKLRIYTLENYLLGAAAKAADQSGFGITQLLPYNYTWIITNLNAEITCLPTHNDTIRIETWIESNAHSLSTRSFRIYLLTDSKPILIGKVRSVWAVLDLTKREIVNAFSMPMFNSSEDGEVLAVERGPRIRSIAEPTGEARHTVSYSDMDYNRHCNSCKYVEMMLNVRFPDFITSDRQNKEETPVKFEITYHREAVWGETLNIIYKETEDDICYQEKNADGLTCCVCRLSKIKDNRNGQL